MGFFDDAGLNKRTTSENLGEAFPEFGEVVRGNLIFPLAFCIAYYLYFALIWLSNPWRVIDYGFFCLFQLEL